jgi:hypothetical protein
VPWLGRQAGRSARRALSVHARSETEKRLLPAELLLARKIVPCKKFAEFSAKSN